MSPDMVGGLVTGRVSGEEGVARVLVALRRLGVPRRRIEVLTDIPLPEGVLGGEMTDTRIPWFTALGLVGGLTLGLFLSVGTLLLYPLLVGSQAIISPPVFVIVYEFTMGGIVVMTAGALLFENRVREDVIRRERLRPLPGEAIVAVTVPPDVVPARIQSALEAAGAEEIWYTPLRASELEEAS